MKCIDIFRSYNTLYLSQLQFEGRTGITPGYIAIKGIHVKNGFCHTEQHTGKVERLVFVDFVFATDYCTLMCKTSVISVFNETRKASRGFFTSPLYPATYGANTTCTWKIQVHPNNIIRLYFLFFELEDHPVCGKDYVAVHGTNKMIGKYCGSRYPEFVESTGNTMVVTFKSDDRVERSGFKARYEAQPSK